ncbi:MAG: holo-ACP synthase [Mycobacterium sp.]|nr:holo-ACP synthase [Mycobacterium sp.]
MTPGQPGIDIVPVARIDRLIRAHGHRFLQRWFTEGEIAYCTAKAVPSRHFAARFAAKEAVAKVIPGRWDGPLPWLSIEIVSTSTGAPTVELSGSVLATALRNGLADIVISMSHCEDYATAVAMTSPSTPGCGADES